VAIKVSTGRKGEKRTLDVDCRQWKGQSRASGGVVGSKRGNCPLEHVDRGASGILERGPKREYLRNIYKKRKLKRRKEEGGKTPPKPKKGRSALVVPVLTLRRKIVYREIKEGRNAYKLRDLWGRAGIT